MSFAFPELAVSHGAAPFSGLSKYCIALLRRQIDFSCVSAVLEQQKREHARKFVLIHERSANPYNLAEPIAKEKHGVCGIPGIEFLFFPSVGGVGREQER